MIPASVLIQLATLGLTPDQASAVANMLSEVEAATQEIAEAALEKSRAKTRDRVQKWRSKNKEETLCNVTGRYETSRNVTKRLVRDPARVEDITSNLEISGQKEENKQDAPKARVSDIDAFRAELPDLDAERLEALIKHRRSKRGTLTGHAAKLFRRDAADCGMSMPQAVDACISRNWITVKPEYFAGRQKPGSTGPPRTVAELAIHRLQTGQMRNEPPSQANGLHDPGDGPGQAESARGAQLIALAGKSVGRIE